MTELPEPPLYQVAYVTRDLERAIPAVQAMRGIPLRDLGDVPLTLDGGDEMVIRIGMGFVRDTMFEVIEPVSGDTGIYTEDLDRRRVDIAFHHLCYKVGSLDDLSRHEARLAGSGHPIVLAGGRGNQSRFVYADFRHDLGHYVEYIYLTPEREAFHNSLPRAD